MPKVKQVVNNSAQCIIIFNECDLQRGSVLATNSSRFVQLNPDDALNTKLGFILQKIINQNLRFSETGIVVPEHYFTSTFAVESSITTCNYHFDRFATHDKMIEWIKLYDKQDYGSGTTVRIRKEVMTLVTANLSEKMIDLADQRHPFIFRKKINRKAIVTTCILFTYDLLLQK